MNMKMVLRLLDAGLVPDIALRAGIRRLLVQRLAQEDAGDEEAKRRRIQEHVEALRRSPVAVETQKANEQHYELPAAFFIQVLGRHLKYSSGLWTEAVKTLDDAEEAMLHLACERAGLRDGMDVLELGCGWGSLTLWMAEEYPKSRITAVSNSSSQREFILSVAARRGFSNVEVVTADMNRFSADRTFDRVVSVEMFEHMRNYEELMARVSRWLKPDGKLFVHIFVHRAYAYLFDAKDDSDWMARYFFTGGQMPSDDLLTLFQRDLALEQRWRVNGRHYERTLLAWLDRMDAARPTVMPILEQVYGPGEARTWFNRWRVFFLACAGLFGYRGGEEWYVAHYLFGQRA